MSKLITIVINGEVDGFERLKELIEKLDELDLWIVDNGYESEFTLEPIQYKYEQPPEEETDGYK